MRDAADCGSGPNPFASIWVSRYRPQWQQTWQCASESRREIETLKRTLQPSGPYLLITALLGEVATGLSASGTRGLTMSHSGPTTAEAGDGLTSRRCRI